MRWIRKSPFRRDEDPTNHMVNLISIEAEIDGVPLSEAEKKLLAEEFDPGKPIPKEFLERVDRLISKILEREKNAKAGGDHKNLGDALEWVEPEYPNIAAFAEEVIISGGLGSLPRLHGKRWIKDRAWLVGCAIALVLALMTIVVCIGVLSARK